MLSVLLLILMGNVSAQEFNIRDQCGDREENMFSINDRSGGHAAEPGYYDNQVCASGVEEVELAETCPDGLSSIVNLYQEEDSHVSVYSQYRLKVCASFPAQINNSCPSSQRIVSMTQLDNAHVGEPGALEHQLCAEGSTVSTVTLEMELDAQDAYVDGEQASEGTYSSSTLEYPYIVSGDPVGIVGYSDPVSVSHSSDGSRKTFSVSQDGGTFLLPNTQGGYEEIENREENVIQRNLLEQLSPSFAYLIPDTPEVRVIYDPDINLTGFDRDQRGSVDLYVRHVSDNEPEPVVEIGLD